nr:RHS repeat-associated core domain-containing protein [uncultured Pseudomonas sp.]
MNPSTSVLGRQTFDGLGRPCSVEVAGRLTRYTYLPGQLPPQANTLADGRRVAFTYEPHLGNALLSSEAEGQPIERLAYHPTLGVAVEAEGELGTRRWQFSAGGQMQAEQWQVDDEDHLTRWQHSLGGRPLSLADSAGTRHERQYDALGRVSALNSGAVRTHFTYDAFSRPGTITSQDTASDKRLSRTFSYDAMGRPSSILFSATAEGETHTLEQTLEYSGLDQLVSRRWFEAQQACGEEQFEYDARGRLTRYSATPEAGIQDPFGNLLVEQRFTFNALDGYREVLSLYTDGSQDQALFSYAEHDPSQPVAISHSHPSWPAHITLSYDACGRLIADSLGRQLEWDTQGRLRKVTLGGRTCQYRYDTSGRVCDRLVDGELRRSFFSGAQLTHERRGEHCLALHGDGQGLFALTRIAEGVRQARLLGCDGQGSVRLQLDVRAERCMYSAHGVTGPAEEDLPFGFAGERREPLTGWYIANGYRPYDPLLMTFLAPDSESPFGRGGLDAYAYCGGDPVNRTDPDGHSWITWTAAGIGLGLAAITTAASLGSVLPAVAALAGGAGLNITAALAVSSAALNVVSLGTGAAALALEASGRDQQAAGVLGWVSLGSGIAGALTGMAPSVIRSAVRLRDASGQAASRAAGFKPYNIGPGGNTRPASVLFGTGPRKEDVAFIPSLFGEGNAALVTHGNLLGDLMNTQGLADKAANVARSVLVPRLAEMGYEPGRKVVLLSCWGGRSGAAQSIANVLGRPVEAYDEMLFIRGVASLQTARSVGPTLQSTNVPMYQAPLWSRWFDKAHFADTDKFRLAAPKLYLPR